MLASVFTRSARDALLWTVAAVAVLLDASLVLAATDTADLNHERARAWLDGVEEPNHEVLQVMLAQSERLGRLVEQLLDLSKLESGEVPLHREEVPLAPLVSQVVSEIDVARSDRGVAVRSRLPDDLPAVDADRERVHQVLFNLVDNAVRFTPEGGEVAIEAHRHNGSVEVTVADTGVGISPEHLPRLFERFFVGRNDHDTHGVGLGLPTALAIAQAHGGRIDVRSAPGRGSTFTLVVPADGPPDGD